MKVWAKYLVVGWSVIAAAIVVVSFTLMKSHFVEEEYEIMMAYKVPEKVAAANNTQSDWELVGENLFQGQDAFDSISITKKQFVERMRKAKGVTIESKQRVKDNALYLYLPLYAFAVWMMPILVFSLLGMLFSGKAQTK